MAEYRTALAYVISVGLLAALALLIDRYIGFAELLAPWRLLSPAAAAAGMAALLLSYFVRALRFYYYFNERMVQRLPLCIKLTCYHNFFNYMLPMRAGEISFPILMARYFEIPVTTSVPVLIWFRLLDLHALLLGALLALPLLGVPIGTTAVLALAWLTLPWFGYRLHVDFARRLTRSTPPERFAKIKAALAALPNDDRRFLSAWAWTLLNWAAKLAVVTLGIVVFVETPALLALATAIGGEISMVLPIHSVAATGTYEAGTTAVLVAGGVSFETALAGSVNLHLFLVAGVLLTGLLAVAIPAPRPAERTR